jgi:hypothetical protein
MSEVRVSTAYDQTRGHHVATVQRIKENLIVFEVRCTGWTYTEALTEALKSFTAYLERNAA